MPFLGYSLVGRGVKYLVVSIIALGLAGSIRALPSRGTSSVVVVLIVLFLLGVWVLLL